MAKDPYAVLGVRKSATQDEIRKAYRNLAKALHPDLNPGNKGIEREFKEINEAYKTLSDPKKKEEFDRFGEAPPEGGRSSHFGGDAGFEDVLSSIFGRMAEKGKPREQTYQVEVDLKDVALGVEKEIALPTDGQRIRVKIPPGVDSGTKLRLSKPDGVNIYIELVVRPSKVLRRIGKDFELELPISLSEAVLGAEIKVPVIDGEVMLKIPAGATSGSKLRLRGKGMPGRAGHGPGDQIVRLKIAMPRKIDPELKEMVRKWGKKHSYDPREGLWNEWGREGRGS